MKTNATKLKKKNYKIFNKKKIMKYLKVMCYTNRAAYSDSVFVFFNYYHFFHLCMCGHQLISLIQLNRATRWIGDKLLQPPFLF